MIVLVWSMIAVIVSFLHSDLAWAAVGATPTKVLQRCCCGPGVGACGACEAERCCGSTAVSGADGCGMAAGVCLEGDRGGAACADFLGGLQFMLALDARGNLFVASNPTSSVLRVSPGGCVTTVLDAAGGGGVAVHGARGLSVSTDGTLVVANGLGNTVFRVTPAGVRRKIADLSRPYATAIDAAGNVFVSLQTEDRVVRVPAAGGTPVTVLDASGDGAGATFAAARGLAVDAAGTLYAAGEASDNVLRVTPDGVRSEIVNQARAEAAGALLDQPFGLAVDAAGNVFVTGVASDNVLRVSPAGEITELLRGPPLDAPREVVVDPAGRVYVTGQLSSNVVRLTPTADGWTHVVLVQGEPEVATPGLGAQNAVLKRARGLAVGADGRVFVAGETTSTVYGIATAPGACGDGVVGVGEECDWARPEDRCCCDARCRLAEAGAPCTDGVHCNGRDRCDAAGRCTLHAGTPCAEAAASGVSSGVCNEETARCDAPDGPPCDDGNPCNGPDVEVDRVCTPTNAFAPVGTPCAADGDPCTRDQCDGNGVCRALPGNAGVTCRAADACREAAECAAGAAVCPAGPAKPDRTPCALAGCDGAAFCERGECACWADACGNGVADPGEQCGEPGLPDGPCCTGCRFARPGQICRTASSACDVAETCDGASAVCPGDVFAPPDTACDDGDPCTMDACRAGACSSVRFCEATLARRARTVGRRGLAPGARAASVLCTNTDPTVRRAVSCSARALLPGAAAGEPAACLEVPGALVAKKVRRRVRRLAATPAGTQEIDVQLRFNALARKAIMAAFRAEERSSVLVCVEFRFEDGGTVTVMRELVLLPSEKLRTQLPGSTPP
ncbi:MAG: hypothetical protein KIT14_05170 [bacterium]|nr:hypothetical protein [bacterium]